MLIENQDAFRTWLTSILEPLCDADPAALAKYVCALVKKDKPLDDLRDGMVDQLDVFLQHETKPFVELLFKTLETQEYLRVVVPSSATDISTNPPQPSTESVQADDIPPAVHQSSYQNRKLSGNGDLSPNRERVVNGSNVATGSLHATVDASGARIVTEEVTTNIVGASTKREREHREDGGGRTSGTSKPRIVLNRSSKFVPATVPKEKPAYATEQTLIKVMPDLLEDSLNEPLASARSSRKGDRKSDSDKEDRRNRGRQGHRSRSPGGVIRSRSRSWERARRGQPQNSNSAQGGGGNQSQGSRGALWRNRSPPMQRYDRRRSRSGSPPPARGPRYRNRSPPPGTAITDIPQNRSRSRSGERFPSPYHNNNLVVSRNRIRVSRERDRERDRLPRDQITRTVNNSDRDRDADRDRSDRDRDRSDRDRERTDRDRDNPRGRPRDDTPTQDSNPGDCANQPRGGATTLAGIFGPAAKKRCRDFDEKGYCMRGDLCQFDHGSDPVVLHAAADAAISRALSMPIPGLQPPRPPVPGCISEYNPLAPDIWSRGVNRFNAPPPPPPQMPPLPLPMPPLPNMANMPGMGGMGPHMHPQHHLQRELIPIQTVRPEDMRPSDPSQPIPGMMPPNLKGGPPHQRMPPHPHNYNSLPPNMLMQGGAKKKPFDFNRLGPNRHHLNKPIGGNSSLELRKIPRGLNDITHLNNHFSKFGKIVNIQVSFEGDPEAAIITFSSHPEANVAYKSTEAVLNNRFIKVFWYNTESKQENVPPGQRAPVKDRLTPPNPHSSNNSTGGATGNANSGSHHNSYHKVLINKDNLKITNTALAEAKQQAAAVAAATLALNNNNNNGDAKNDDTCQPAVAKPPTSQNPVPGAPTLAPPGSMNVTLLRTAALNNAKENVANTPASVELAALVKRREEGTAKIARDLRRRTQQLLEKQLQQHKTLIAKLETTVTDSKREMLSATIKSIREGIEKTKKELISQPKTNHLHQAEESYVSSTLSKMYIDPKSQQYDPLTISPSIVGHFRKHPRTQEEAQKEILDAELDLFTKQQEGQDVGDLQRRIAELRRQQLTMKAGPVIRRALPLRTALRAKYSKLAAMGALKNSQFIAHSVDHRPRSLLVSGYEADEQDQVLVHLAQFGEIVEKVVDRSTPSVWVQYRLRNQGELAVLKGKQFNDRTLSVTWSQQPMALRQPTTPAAIQPAEIPVEPASEPVSSASTSVAVSKDTGDASENTSKPSEQQIADNATDNVTDDIVKAANVEKNIPKVQHALSMDDQDFEGGLDISEDILLNDDEEDDEENEDRSWRR